MNEKKTTADIRGERVTDILETLTQEYFDSICEKLSYRNISGTKRISKNDLFTIRATVGPITYDNFVAYVESMGIYTLDET